MCRERIGPYGWHDALTTYSAPNHLPIFAFDKRALDRAGIIVWGSAALRLSDHPGTS